MRRSAERGFTLIELMVVITIVALASAAVVIALPDGRNQPRAAALAFAAQASAARDAAIVGSRDTRVSVTGAGYSVEQRRGGVWAPLAERGGRLLPWPRGVGVSGPALLSFDTTGGSTAAGVTLAYADRRAQVSVGADGTVRVDP